MPEVLSLRNKLTAAQMLTANAAEQIFKLSVDINDRGQRETTSKACKLARNSLGELLNDLSPTAGLKSGRNPSK
jgi:hypothetical protein